MRPASISLPSSLATPIPLPLMVAAFCVLWASAFSVAKLAIADCPPLLLLTIRFFIAGAVILGIAFVRGVPMNLSRHDVALFALLGIANQAAYLGLGYVGLKSVSSGFGALVISTNPVLTAVLAAIFLREPMTWQKTVGLVLGVGGVAFIVESRLASGLDHPIGITFIIAALVSLV